MDSFGCGQMPDSEKFGDVNVNTLKTVMASPKFNAPNLLKMGLGKLNNYVLNEPIIGSVGKMAELSNGKDTIIGHWEIAGLISKTAAPVYKDGFPKSVIDEFEKRTGRKVICNKPYSGTEVIKEYGEEHIKTGALIVYTSQDSVFQIAAHEDIVSVEELYRYCRIAREILQGENAVLRVIARPFIGEYPFIRTSNRHDFSLTPPSKTMLDIIYENKLDSIAIGKIIDIFTERGMNKKIRIVSNFDGMEKTINEAKTNDFTGLCFVNLVDFDSKYGHRRDIDGYAQAVTEFDVQLGILQESINEDDLIIITADHGCDPAYKLSTDHTREYVPVLCYSKNMNKEIDLGLRKSFADISSTILENFGLQQLEGKSFLKQLI